MNYKVDYAFQIVGMHLVSALITLVSLTVNGCCQLMNQENMIFLKIIYILILHISPVNPSHSQNHLFICAFDAQGSITWGWERFLNSIPLMPNVIFTQGRWVWWWAVQIDLPINCAKNEFLYLIVEAKYTMERQPLTAPNSPHRWQRRRQPTNVCFGLMSMWVDKGETSFIYMVDMTVMHADTCRMIIDLNICPYH